MHPALARAVASHRPNLATVLAGLDAHRDACDAVRRRNWMRPALPPRPALPVVDLGDEDRAEMALVNVRSLRHDDLRDDPDAGDVSWDELFIAWRAHSLTHFGCAWKQVDGSALMYSHVSSAVHILRKATVADQA